MPATIEVLEQAFAQESGELFLEALPARLREDRRPRDVDGLPEPPRDFPRPTEVRPIVLPTARVA